MKKIVYGLLVAALLLGCKKESPEQPQKNYVLLSGNVENPKSDKLKINGLTNNFSATLNLSEGIFKDTLHAEEGNYMFYDGAYVMYFYIKPGDSLNLTYNGENPYETLRFTGNDATANNYLAAKRNKERDLVDGVNVFTFDEQDFVFKEREVKQELLAMLEATKGLTDDFKVKERNNIQYSYLEKLKDYERNHQYYTKDSTFKASANLLEGLTELELDKEDDFKYSYSYIRLLDNHVSQEAQTLSETQDIAYDVALLKAINKLENTHIKNNLLYKNAQYGITRTSDLQAYYDAFMKGSSNETHKEKITESYKQLKNVMKGMPSPAFADYEDSKGSRISLEDLKGRYVYIDVWATWCGPCKAEIPYLKKVEEKYKDSNIQFVSISIDKLADRDKWKNMVRDEHLGGIQLLADNAFESQFVQDYYIKGIPKFIFLDPEGKILDPNAPRPSDAKLIQLFEKYKI